MKAAAWRQKHGEETRAAYPSVSRRERRSKAVLAVFIGATPRIGQAGQLSSRDSLAAVHVVTSIKRAG